MALTFHRAKTIDPVKYSLRLLEQVILAKIKC